MVVDHSTSNTSDLCLHSLSEIKATIILRIKHHASVSALHPRTLADVPVEIVEEAQQIEPELDETLLFVPRQCPENFCCIVHVVFIPNPVEMKRSHSW